MSVIASQSFAIDDADNGTITYLIAMVDFDVNNQYELWYDTRDNFLKFEKDTNERKGIFQDPGTFEEYLERLGFAVIEQIQTYIIG